MIKRALLSVSDKTNLVELAKILISKNIEILATGGTANLLKQHNISLTEVSDVTQFPEIMNGRVKTLHPKIHGGILARRGLDDLTLNQHDIQPIDLIIVNLYPFQNTINKPDTTLATAIENIDIGGPTMLRAAAKNHEYVTVIVDPADYLLVQTAITEHGDTDLATRRYLAQKTFTYTTAYDAAIANYLKKQCQQEDNPVSAQHQKDETHILVCQPAQTLRYGENPHQQAMFYHLDQASMANGTLGHAQLLQGKPLSYNNMMDADAAWRCAQGLDDKQAGCVIIKHATPCGVAQAENLLDAYQKAFATDSQSAFGGIIAVNCALDADTASTIIQQQFVEVIIAPKITPEAQAILKSKTNLRLLVCGHPQQTEQDISYRSISGGLLMQETDQGIIDLTQFQVVSQRQPTPQEIADMHFAWRVVRFVKSNAIVFAANQQTLGIGTGQTSRVFSTEIAMLKAKAADLSLTGAAMASDAFFPFTDSVEIAAKAGITAVIQPGGSKRDPEVIAAADALGLAMIVTGKRHFLH
jgi:phosphoribosylaminoimidazolecarboxamide formyltransferase/IMP cyclohydrolase